MYIPSYDDLTPPIPDVGPGDVFDEVATVLPSSHVSTSHVSTLHVARGTSHPPSRGDGDRASARQAVSTCHGATLFACLRSTRAAAALFAIAKDFSPRIQRYGAACVVLDVSGLGRLLGDADAIGAELSRALREGGTAAHVAVAATQTAAQLLAYARAGLTVVTADLEAALAPIPLSVLRAMVEETVGDAASRYGNTFDVLGRWGLTAVGEFAALPAAALSERVGQSGLALQRLACGIDASPLVPDPGVPRFVQSIELEWPIEELEALAFVLPRLLDPLAASLERADRGAAAVRVDLRLADRTVHSRMLQLPAPMRDPRVLRTLVLLDLESHPPAAGIDVVTIEVDPAPARIIQYSLLERARPSAETIATLTARLHALIGGTRCGAPVLLDTHRPDAFELHPFKGEERRASGESPFTLHSSPFLRRFRPPIAIRVAVERGRPVHVAIDRRGMPGGRVERAAGPWRTSGSWWDAAGTRWDRDEWDVALGDGSLCRLFYDRLVDRWFMEGVFD